MQCEKVGDEALQGDKLDVVYGEADVAARDRVHAHLERCPACRDELAALRGLRRDLAAWRLPEARQREAERPLPSALGQADGGAAFLAQLDARIDERLRSSRTRERESFERQLANWQEQADVRRRADMAQVAASLSYLDGRHGQQLARTNELLGYFLQASDKR